MRSASPRATETGVAARLSCGIKGASPFCGSRASRRRHAAHDALALCQKDRRDIRAHEVRQGPRQYRTHGKRGDLGTALLGDAAERRQQDRGGREVRKPAECKGRDRGHTLVGQRAGFHQMREIDVAHELVEHELLADQPTDHGVAAGGDADRPGDGCEEQAEQVLEREAWPRQRATERAQRRVDQRDHADERDQHRAHHHGDMDATRDADGDRFENAGEPRVLAVRAQRFGITKIAPGHENVGEQQPARDRHQGGGQQGGKIDAERGVAREDGAGDRGRTARHGGEELGAGEATDRRADADRQLALAEQRGEHGRERGDRRDAEQEGDGAADPGRDDGDDAEVEQDLDDGGDVDDLRQDADCEDEAVIGIFAEIAEHEGDARRALGEHGVDAVRERRDGGAAGGDEEGQGADRHLECQRARDDAGADRAAIGGEQDADRQQQHHAG